MKIAVISDVHNNELNLKKVLDYCAQNEIGKIICCGDLASIETLDYLNDNFKGKIFFVFGNMDNDYLKNYPFENNQYKNTKLFRDIGEAEIEGKKIAFVHFPKAAKQLCVSGKYDFVFYGHTHKPFEEMVNECKMLNPGNVGNQIFPPTFAVWDTKNDSFQLVRINDLK